MVWDPPIAVFDERSLKDNLIEYLSANQADALLWANDGTALDAIKDFHRSPRLVTRFPALTFVQTQHVSDYEDTIIVDLSILLELAIIHGNQDTLTEMAPKYSMALESMLTNIPKTTFNQDSIMNPQIARGSIETVFDVQGKFKNKFIEVFQTRVSWRIVDSAY